MATGAGAVDLAAVSPKGDIAGGGGTEAVQPRSGDRPRGERNLLRFVN